MKKKVTNNKAAAGLDAKVFATALTASISAALDKAFTPVVKMLTDNQTVLSQIAASSKKKDKDTEDEAAKKLELAISAGSGSAEEENEESDVEASGEEEIDEDDTDVSAEGEEEEETGEEEEEEEETGEEEEEEEEVMETSKVKASMKQGKKKDYSRTMSAAAAEIGTLRASVRKLTNMVKQQALTVKRQSGLIKKMEAQSEVFAEQIQRRSLPPEASALLEKAGLNVAEMKANGTKLSISAVDQILAEGAPGLDPKHRMGIKNLLLQHDLMEQGVVKRDYN